MTVLKDKILDIFITELQERALLEFQSIEAKNQNRHERIRDRGLKLREVLTGLSEENRQVIENYLKEKDNLICDELDHVYLQGIKDCCMLLKILNLI